MYICRFYDQNDCSCLKFQLWHFVGTLHRFLPNAVCVMVSFWWLYAIVIIATYTGNLIAFLTVENTRPPFQTLMELATQQQYEMGTLGGTAWEYEMKVGMGTL